MAHRTTCNRDCPDSCAALVTVEQGKAVRLVGDRGHPVTRGFLCSQGRDYLKRQYHPERVIHPWRRTASGWERIAWDDALDLAAEQLQRCRREPTSVLALTYSGMRGHVQKSIARLFWACYGGATCGRGGLSVEPILAAQERDFGAPCTHAPEDLVHARAFVLWGRNPVVTRQHWIPFMDEARKRGARVLVIDPVPSATARRADRHFALRPGTDRFLAVGIARLLIERNRIDREFVRDHGRGFEALRDLVLDCPMEEVLSATDLPLSAVEELAGVYGEVRPVSTHVGLGACYWPHGGETVRFIDALAAMSGNLGIPGGGVCSDISSELPALPVPVSLSRTLRMPLIGRDILAARDPALRLGWIAGANPCASAPDTHEVDRAMRSLEFLVVVDQFMTATARHAHLLLPCTTWLEADDVVTAYGHHWVGLTRRVVAPEGEARSDVEIYQALASRLGFGSALEGTSAAWLQRLTAPVMDPARLLERAVLNPSARAVPFHDRKFGTPSGRFEFVRELTEHAAGAGLRLLAAKTRRMLNSQVLPEDLPREAVVRVHPDTLAARHLSHGDAADLVSSVGRVRVRLQADDTLRRDLVWFGPAQWKGDSSGVNQLRVAIETDLGCGAAMHATPVKLEPVR